MKLHLQKLEEESISITKDTYSSSENPAVLYSIGKDSSVLLHLFRKSFFPSKIPVPFLHIDTGWKFKEMINFRNNMFKKYNLKGIVKTNMDGVRKNINPFDHANYTDIMKTEALKLALKEGSYDFIYGGARRNEESSRSKEKVLSFRDKNNVWNPKNLYKNSFKKKKNVTGLHSEYDAPDDYDLLLDTENLSIQQSVNRLLKILNL